MEYTIKQYVPPPGDRPLYGFLNAASQQMANKHPERWRAIYPRRIVTPHGYPNPRYAALTRFSHAMYSSMKASEVNKTMRDCMVISWKLIELDCPTFFATHDLLEDLVDTDPPPDMELSELKWPFDAMMFVLPNSFHKYFPRPVPFIAVAKAASEWIVAGEKVEKYFPGQLKVGYPETLKKGAFFLNSMAILKDFPYDYAMSYPMGTQIKIPLSDTDFVTDKEAPLSVIPEDERTTLEEDLEILHKSAKVALWLMLAMMARPQYVDQGPILHRPASIKRGKVVKEALWNPDFIGRTYVRSVPQGGHHASPRLHRRRGHMRMQPHGPNNSERKLIWIEHTWVGA